MSIRFSMNLPGIINRHFFRAWERRRTFATGFTSKQVEAAVTIHLPNYYHTITFIYNRFMVARVFLGMDFLLGRGQILENLLFLIVPEPLSNSIPQLVAL